MRDEWAGRRVMVQDIREEASRPFQLGTTPARLRIVSHVVDGNRHYGAIVTPDGAAARSLGVLVYAHGGDNGVHADELALVALGLGELADDFVYVAPSFRAEAVRHAGSTWTSEGEPSPWDRDVDDALALLRVAFRTENAADSTRVAALGFSRGGNVAMLMGIRDPVVDAVVEFFGPTDFFGEFAQDVTTYALRDMLPDLPGVRYLNARIIQPLRRGDIPIDAARHQMLLRSAAYFAHELPLLQVHHGTQDDVVPFSQAESLDREMRENDRRAPSYQFHAYPGGDHSVLTLPGSTDRTTTFLRFLVR